MPRNSSGLCSITITNVVGSRAAYFLRASATRSSISSTVSGTGITDGTPNRSCSGSCTISSHRSRSDSAGIRSPRPSPRIRFMVRG